jgi:hypothetical protein
MAHTTLRGRPGRATPPALALLLLGGLLLVAAPSGAADKPADPKDKDAAKDKDKDKDKGVVKPPEPLNLVIVGKDKQHAEQVADTVKFINDKLEAQWKAQKPAVVPSRYTTDDEFIRRVSLDITGRIATPEEIEQYLKDPKEKRRSLLIERLLADKDGEYSRHWSNLWANWLLTRSGAFGRGDYHEQMSIWLEDQFASNTHYNKLVEKLLTAEGKNTDNGAVNFILAHVGEDVAPERRNEDGRFQMVPVTSRITRLFLGTQVQCAQCHDHPFYNNIHQKDFWGVNAFLRQVDRDGTPPPPANQGMMQKAGPLTLKDNTAVNKVPKSLYEKRNGVLLTAKAEFLPSGDDKGGRLQQDSAGGYPQGIDRRKALAEYVTNHDMFARAYVNRLWGVFFGRGFVNPVDDFNDQNKPSNPELLNELAVRFKNYDYDQKELIRWICNSNAYNLSCVANATNDKQEQEVFFSRMVLKSMSPEQLFESLMTATKAEAGETKDAKKEAKRKWLDSLISNFGDDEGNEVNFNGTVVQALMMMNGPDINDAIGRPDKGTVALALKKHGDKPAAVIRELFLATLNREPTGKEINTLAGKFGFHPDHVKLQIEDAKHPERKYQDLFWALLNSNEFLLNH